LQPRVAYLAEANAKLTESGNARTAFLARTRLGVSERKVEI
jgi:hypothetical protein